MNHFDILCSYLKETHRNISNNQIRKLGKLRYRAFNTAKKEFIFPLRQVMAKTQATEKPVRLILDYVLISQQMLILTRPFNLLYNPNTKRLEPVMVVLFAIVEIGTHLYPVACDFWVQELMLEEDEVYFSKTHLAEHLILQLLQAGLKVDEVLFDAGFCEPMLLEVLNSQGIAYICRFPRNRRIGFEEGRFKAEQLFQNNRSFFYDRHLKCYLNKIQGFYAQHTVQLIVSANRRENLIKRRYYCLITNQLSKLYTQVLRSYQHRGKIESFFRTLKSYLGLCSFYRHDEDKTLYPHFQMCGTGFILLQELSFSTEKTIFQALQYLKTLTLVQIKETLQPFWSEWAESIVKSSTQLLVAA